MKLKVVLGGGHLWIEADTIDTLKASIMVGFSLTADDLSKRLLVRDDRDHLTNQNPITGCVDLLQLADGSTLAGGDHCNDGDTLVLGWKGPCFVRLVTDFILGEGHSIQVDNSFTLLQLKRKIKRLTGESVTEDNLPEVLFKGDEKKPLLFFGFYRFWKVNYSEIMIHRHKNNMPVSIYPVKSMVTWDANGKKCFHHIREHIPVKLKSEWEEEKTESKENIEKKKKKKKNTSRIIQA